MDNSASSVARVSRGSLTGETLEVSARDLHVGPNALHRRTWTLPLKGDQLRLESARSIDGKEWTSSVSVTFEPQP